MAGGTVTFAAPSSGASVTFTETVATIGPGGSVSLAVTANASVGAYIVTGVSTGSSSAALYSLSNTDTVAPTYTLFLPLVTK